ncbi:PLD nuclease N-terminal domain-containing protein [Paenibacillus sp. N4]|uniref:PLD nuclease N-terminal domain-containing protein n=1 Tax=Paenibacillus vietnamensis TaxID=2590547 RepID=UPI001CD143BB|nr:PLD nuclease N-terminal domain-containing protein [Paenibacillus vietnamensis]MCA0756784.1 PLD nuclease N-terminal domain-containing protein [Paenibacillus vietnamensis]
MNENIDVTQLLPILAPIFLIQLVLMVFALVLCLKAERTRGPKWMWALIIIFVNLAGPIAFFLFGRRNDG